MPADRIKITDEMREAFQTAAGWPAPPWRFGQDVTDGLTAVLALVERDYFPYFCPTSGDVESPTDGGFGLCCDRPDLHCWPPPPLPLDAPSDLDRPAHHTEETPK